MKVNSDITRILAVTLLLVTGVFLTALIAHGQAREVVHGTPVSATTNSSIQPQPHAKAVARVNGAVLTDVDLLREMYAIFPYAKQHNGSFPRAMEADIRRGALKMIEFEELVYQEAKRRRMIIAPARLALAEALFRRHFSSEEEYVGFIQAETNASVPVLRAKIARSLLIEDLLKAEVTNKSAVSMVEARAFYRKNPERFKVEESYSVQTITIMPPVRPTPKRPNVPPPNPDQLKQMLIRAEDALRQAKATKTFEEFGLLAQKISEDDYRVMMGYHKPVAPKEMPPEVLQAASKLQAGQISDITQAEGAYTIVRLNAHTAARMQAFNEVSQQLRHQLRLQKTEALRRGLDAELRKNASVEEF